MLIEQTYPGEKDNEAHFYSLLPAFKDPRYIRIDNKPIFLLFKPLKMRNACSFIKQWQTLAKANGLDGIFFIGQGVEAEFDRILSLGFDAVNHEEINKIHAQQSWFVRLIKQVKRKIFNMPRCYDYLKAMRMMVSPLDYNENIFPTICPNFDHTPRSGNRGIVYTKCTPERFKKHASQILDIVSAKNRRIIFIKSWNEWGEGNYMEPDLQFGDSFIRSLGELMKVFQ